MKVDPDSVKVSGSFFIDKWGCLWYDKAKTGRVGREFLR
jgi:hypothetical protein